MSSPTNPQLKPPEAATGLLSRPRTRQALPQSHGGAWKVAYADFVTAMMALFLVMWLMNSTERVKASVTGYFRDPRGYTEKRGAGPAGAGEGLAVNVHNVAGIQHRIEEALHSLPDFPGVQEHVRFSVTGEGLRIELTETEQGLFFTSGEATPTPEGEQLLQLLAQQLVSMPNQVVIEGHTDSRPFRNTLPSSGYGNWELSTDRANAARRLLHAYGLRPQQVVEVRGYADQKLLDESNPDSVHNRRISLVVKF
jgi:chemotaxis protein MotB